jgi:tetratricopeptide (TPR) repeat protein
MRTGRLALVLFCASFVPGAAAAQTKQTNAGPRRDDAGIKGISPFWETLKKGDNAYVARDFDGAISAYREAIQKQPQNPMGHYRIGEAHLAKGDEKEAEAAFVAGLRYTGKDHSLRTKLLFVLADLRERQKAYDEATDGWAKYEAAAREAQQKAKTFPGTAVERKKRITEWKKLLDDYGAVKDRIAKRLSEADDKARKSAQDPANK